MQAITVRRNELLGKIKENRAKHRAVFEEALDGYRALAIKELDAILEEARNGKRIRRGLSLIEPQDHTKDYDRIISMLEMEVEETIDIDEQSFAWYVLDDWAWKQQFTQSVSAYVAQV